MTDFIDSEQLFLTPSRFGTADRGYRPDDGYGGSSHNSVKPCARIGLVVQQYYDGTVGAPGYSEIVYLRAAVDVECKTVCVPDEEGYWYEFTLSDGETVHPLAVIA